MKIWRGVLILSIMAVIVLSARMADAGGLLGRRYIAVEIGQMRPGDDDLRDIDDSILHFHNVLNVPWNANLDLRASVSHTMLDGGYRVPGLESKATTLRSGVNYHFSPDRQMDPYITAGIGCVRSEVKAGSGGYRTEEDEDDFSFLLGSGVEIDITDSTAIKTSIVYSRVHDEDDIWLGLSVSLWFNDTIFGGIGGSYALDDENKSFSGAIGIGF